MGGGSRSALQLSRRDLLRSGLLAAGALAGGGVLGSCGSSPPTVLEGAGRYRWPVPVARRKPGSLPFPDRPPGTDTMPEIEHVVVLMMENHSYDNYLGMLGRGDGFSLGPDGMPTNWNPTTDGRRQLAFPMTNDCQQDGKPSQEWADCHAQFAGGTNAGFVGSPSGPVAMGYWDRAQLPFYYSLASTFPLADRWFCSLLGQTFPNRRFLTAATSAGMVNDVLSQAIDKPPNGTIMDRLDQHKVSWRNYFHTAGLPTIDVWFDDHAAHEGKVVAIDQFFSDAAAGTLPGVSIVDPDFGTQSEEDPQNIAMGQRFASQVVSAVMQGPGWPKTLLVWTYDEHGGYYDHVPPPPALAPDDIAPLSPVKPNGPEKAYDGFRRYGFRVPAAVVSPFARKDHVTHVIHDHTSILAMVERKWNLPALTYRDANAADLMDFLDLSTPAFMEPPTLAAPLSVGADCSPGQAGALPPVGSVR